MRLKDGHYLLFIAMLAFALFVPGIISGEMFSAPGAKDWHFFVFFNYYQASDWKKDRVIHLWNPFYSCGQLVDLANAPLYPIRLLMVMAFTDNLLSDNPWTGNLLFPFHVALAGVFMFMLLRRFNLGLFPALTGAMAYMLCGRLLSTTIGLLPQLSGMALLPANVYFLERLLGKTNRLLFALLLGLSMSLTFLSGHVQFFFYNALTLVAYYIIRSRGLRLIRKDYRPLAAETLRLALAVLVFLLLSAVLILPYLEFSQYLNRVEIVKDGWEYVVDNSYHPAGIIAAIMPHFFGLGDYGITFWGLSSFDSAYVYIGVLPLILACFSFARRSRGIYLLWGAIMLLFLLAMGKYSPVFYVFYKILPGFSLFRDPSRILIIAVFCMSILTAIGTAELMRLKNKRPALRILLTLAVLSIAGAAAAILLSGTMQSIGESVAHKMYFEKYPESIYVQTHSYEFVKERVAFATRTVVHSAAAFGMLFVMSAGLVALFLKRRLPVQWFMVLAAALIFADVAYFAQPFVQTQDSSEKYAKNSIVEHLEMDDSEFRVFSQGNSLQGDYLVRHGIYNALGSGLSKIIYFDQFMKAAYDLGNYRVDLSKQDAYAAKMLGMLNVKYLIAPESMENPDYEHILEDGGLNLYINRKAMPRAYLMGQSRILPHDKVLDYMKSESFHPASEVILEDGLTLQGGAAFRELHYSAYEPQKIELQLTTDAPAYAVFSEAWYPGWRAWNSGQEVEVLRCNYMMRCIHLEPGQHDLRMQFVSMPFITGTWISLLSGGMVAVLLAAIAARRLLSPPDRHRQKARARS